MSISNVSIRRRLHNTRKSALARGKDFNLDFDYMKNILNQTRCAYSGEKFSSGMNDNSLTLERWDNDKGYVKGNVIPVKLKYNNMRGSLTIEQMAAASKTEIANIELLDRPETLKGKAKQYYTTLERVKANIAGRVKTLERLMLLEEHTELEKIQMENTLRRINTATEEIAKLEASLGKELMNLKADLNHKVKTSKKASQAYSIITKGLLRFEYMNAHNYVRLKRGLPMIIKGE